VGHYKAAATDYDLSILYAKLLYLPLRHGFSYDRWKLVTDVMLLKKANDIRLHRLRIVQLVEADFNQFLRIALTRPLAHKGEDLGWIHDSQFARSEQTCLTAVLLKVLTYEYMRINRRNGASMDNDAKGCFDRIIPVLALIACQALIATIPACQSLGSA
jgi:hypothetical protein